MEIYFSQDGWRLLNEEGVVFFCFIDPGHSGSEIKIEINKEFMDYLLNDKPSAEVIMTMLHKKGFMKV